MEGHLSLACNYELLLKLHAFIKLPVLLMGLDYLHEDETTRRQGPESVSVPRRLLVGGKGNTGREKTW